MHFRAFACGRRRQESPENCLPVRHKPCVMQIWSVESALLLASCRGHQGEVTDLAVNADNKIVASSSNDAVIRCWSLQVGDANRRLA